MRLSCPKKNQKPEIKNQKNILNIKKFLNFKIFPHYSSLFTHCSRRRRGGFTLIEILVTVSIIGILTTIGIASYNNFNEQRKIRRAADELKSYIRLAASRANNNEKDATVCTTPADTLDGWYIDFSPLRIYGKCGGTEFKSQNIDSFGVSVSPATGEIRFLPLASGGGTDLATSLTITVGGVGGVTLTVDPSGNVY